jgi:hypothetical protein
MKSQRKNYSRKNKKTKKNVKRNSRSRKMRGGMSVHNSYLKKNQNIANSKENLQTTINKIKDTKNTEFVLTNDNNTLKDSDNIDIIGDAIVDNKHITKVVINNCSLDNKGAINLLAALQNSNVTSIDLQSNELAENKNKNEDFLSFLESIIPKYTKLTSLNVMGNPIATNDRMLKILNMVQAHNPQNENLAL